MSGRILLLVLALVVLTGYQSINSQTAGSFNGFVNLIAGGLSWKRSSTESRPMAASNAARAGGLWTL